MNPEDLLQDRLIRLEAGEPLETVIADLPQVEAELVRMAASLRVAASIEQSNTAAQRQQLMRAAKERKTMSPQKSRPSWLWPTALAGGLATVFVCVAVVAVGSLAWWWLASNPPVAREATPVPVVKATDAPAIVQSANPETAALTNVRGVVEIQTSDGTWAKTDSGALVRAGARLRTRALSSATLIFYDGSQTRLGPDTELSIDALNAPKSGARVIALTQWLGDSDHTVAKSDDPASRYDVRTPSGTGQAKGTVFHVSVNLAQNTRFAVTEGAVEVINLDVIVLVVAGQSSTVLAGQAPQPPVFRIEGEGEVTQIGAIWKIAGYGFLTDATTEIIGEPRVGDWVTVTGHLLPDGKRFADRIVLLHRAFENRFTFTGAVDAIGETEWTIAGQIVHVDDVTRIEPGLAVGDVVEVRGGIADDGTLWATSIQRVVPNGFRFTGVIESVGAEAWVVSGISVTVNVSTTIEPDIVVGDRVLVIGQILDDGTWQALTINKIESETFDFIGIVISTDPWMVSGIALETDERTQIDDDIEVGNRVRARGRVLADGTWLAESIEQLDEGQRHHIQFTARVQSIDPWVVGAASVTVDDKTKIIGDIAVGDWVTVKGNLLPDGTVLAKKIIRVSRAQGCLIIATVVRVVEANQLILFDGQTVALSEGLELKGEPQIASVILVQVCVDEDGTLRIIRIIVVFQLSEVPIVILPPDGGGDNNGQRDCKEGPGLGLGHCKDKHDDKHDDDD